MATIASLDIALGANSAKLKKDLDKAKKQTKNFSKQTSKHAASVSKAFKGIAVAAGAITAAIGAGALLKNADAMIKQARGAGVAFEAFQKLEFGLEQSGIQSGALSKAMVTLNKKLVIAARGSKEASDMLSQIGTSYEELNELSPEKRFEKVIRGLSGITDEGRRSAIAAELLGEQFAGTNIDMDAVIESSDRLVTITAKNAEMAEAFNDSLNNMRTNLSNIATNAIGPLLPYMQSFSEALTTFSANNPTMSAVVAGLTAVTAAVIGLGTAMTIVGAPYIAIAAAMASAIVGIVYAVNNWESISVRLNDFLSNNFNITLSQVTGWLDKMWQSLKVAGEWAVKLGNWYKDILLVQINLVISAIKMSIGFWTDLYNAIADLFSMEFGGFAENMKAAFSNVNTFFVNVFGVSVTDIVKNIKTQFSWAMEAAATVFSNALGSAVGYVLEKLEVALNKAVAVANFFKAGLDPVDLSSGDWGNKQIPERPGWIGSTTGTPLDPNGSLLPQTATPFVSNPPAVTSSLLVGNTTGTPLDPNSFGMPPRLPTSVDPTSPTSPSGGGGGSSPAGKVKEAAEAVEEGLTEIQEKAVEFGKSIKNDFSSALSEGLKTGNWKDVLLGFVDGLTSKIIDNFATSLTDAMFGDWFDDIFKNFGKNIESGMKNATAGAGAGAGGGGTNWLSLGLSLLGFADGGIVPKTPGSVSYKDSVPAMLTPGELVVPADEVGNFANSGKASGTTVNLNVTGDISRQTRKEIMDMLPQITHGVNSNNHEAGYDYT